MKKTHGRNGNTDRRRRAMPVDRESHAFDHLIERTPSVYGYPLLVKHLLHTALATTPTQEIAYRDLNRYDYRTLRERIGKLATALARLGVEPGDTVAVMDWDSHRYPETYFAVPMMAAVLQTVNIRLSPEQILYTLNHARPTVVLVHADFLPMPAEIEDRIESVKTYVLLTDGADPSTGSFPIAPDDLHLLPPTPP